MNAWHPLYSAKQQTEELVFQSIYWPYLRLSPEKTTKLSDAIDVITEQLAEDSEYVLTELDIWPVKHAAEQLKTILLAELAALPAFLVTTKENYDVDRLISMGAGLFPANMILKAPETQDDAQEAGQCLAFERNTACGFHTYRVVEAVVRRYWDAVTSGKDRPKIESLGKMAAELSEGNFGDQKVSQSLLQLARLHRNPLAHPEVVLTADEAIAALGMARSAITPMLAVLPDVPPTTGKP